MTGTIKIMNSQKQYGFIRVNNTEYFFHRDDLADQWGETYFAFQNNKLVTVEFDPINTPKGPRAANVKRID